MIPQDIVEKICDSNVGAHGSEIHVLFGTIKGYCPYLTFDEIKEVFFWLIEKLLIEKKIMFKLNQWIKKDEGMQQKANEDALWNAPPKVITDHLRNIFPDEITDDLDIELFIFFLSKCPHIVWIYEGNRWVGSKGQWVEIDQ